MAAAIYAKGLDAARYEPLLKEALAAATELGVELPPLPTTVRPDDLEAAVIEGLRGEASVTITGALSERAGPAAAAAV